MAIVGILGLFAYDSIANSGIGSLGHEDITNPQLFQKHNFFALDFTNFLFTCEQKSEMYRVTNNVPTLVASDYDNFNTIIPAEIVQRHSGEKIDSLRIDTFQRCDFPDGGTAKIDKLTLTNANVFIRADTNTSFALSGGTNLATTTKPITDKTYQDNQWVQLSSYTLNLTEEVEKKLLKNSSDNSYVIFTLSVTGDIKAHIVGQDGSNQGTQDSIIPTVASQTGYVVKVREGTVTPDPIYQDTSRADKPIFFDDILQTKPTPDKPVAGLTMDMNDGAQLLIEAVMREYKTTDGLPTVTITGQTFTGHVNVKLALGLDAIEAGDGKFSTHFLMPRDATGTFTFKMEHPFRNTFDTETVTVLNADREPVSDPIIEGDITATAKAVFQYIHRFQNVPIDDQLKTVIDSGVASDGSTGNIALSITDDVSIQGQKIEGTLEEIQLNSKVFFENDDIGKFKRSESSTTTYKATLEVDGKTIEFTPFSRFDTPIPNICAEPTEATCPEGHGIIIDEILISKTKLHEQLVGIEQNQQDIKITVEATGGTFSLLDVNNKIHSGSLKGLSYSWTFTFGSQPIEHKGSSCETSDPNVPCTCPDGQVFGVDVNGEIACVDPETKTTTSSDPKTNTSQEEFDFNTDPHCETNAEGDVIATFGEITVNSPGCENLFGDGPVNTVTNNNDVIYTDNSDETITGDDKPTVIVDCETGDCSQESIDKLNGFLNNFDGELMTYLAIILIIITVIVIIAYVLKKKRR